MTISSFIVVLLNKSNGINNYDLNCFRDYILTRFSSFHPVFCHAILPAENYIDRGKAPNVLPRNLKKYAVFL